MHTLRLVICIPQFVAEFVRWVELLRDKKHVRIWVDAELLASRMYLMRKIVGAVEGCCRVNQLPRPSSDRSVGLGGGDRIKQRQEQY